jgi:hypothetical protein
MRTKIAVPVISLNTRELSSVALPAQYVTSTKHRKYFTTVHITIMSSTARDQGGPYAICGIQIARFASQPFGSLWPVTIPYTIHIHVSSETGTTSTRGHNTREISLSLQRSVCQE